MRSRSRYSLAYHFGGNARSLISESRAHPGTRPGVAHIFGKRVTCYPKSPPSLIFCIQYAAPPRRHKLRSTWLLSIVMPIRYLSGALVETVLFFPYHSPASLCCISRSRSQ